VDSDEKLRIVVIVFVIRAYRSSGSEWKLEVSFLYSRMSTVRFIESTNADQLLDDPRSSE